MKGIIELSETQKQATSCEELNRFIDELQRDYATWYTKSVGRLGVYYGLLQALSLISGFLTSILAALITKETFETKWRIALIALPALGSLAAAVLLQFRVYDLWQLRHDARIAFQNLVNEGRKRHAAAKSAGECYEIHESLQLRATELETDQKNRFFALTRPEFVAMFKSKKE